MNKKDWYPFWVYVSSDLYVLGLFSLLYTLCECFTNVANARIQWYSSSSSILTWLAHFYHFLIPVSSGSLAVYRLASVITYIYLLARLTELNARAIFFGMVVSAISSNNFSFFPFFRDHYIFHYNWIGMAHVMPSYLRVVLFFVCSVVESFKKILMHRLIIGSIIVYHITIIPHTPNKMTDSIKLEIV